MKKKTQKIYLLKILAISFALIALLGAGYYLKPKGDFISVQQKSNDFFKVGFLPSTENSEPQENLPNSYLIKNFPFASQAPLTNWDELHDEACEEASVILVNYYLNNLAMTNENMEQEIQKMIQWEIANWGTHKDLSASETLQMAKKIYKLDGKVKKNGSIELLKKEIASGNPVIVPTAGRLLGNPNFRSPGPVYHMVVAIGYYSNEIIVQDVGTRNGNQYKYNSQIFLNAWHDWTGNSEDILSGEKNYLVLND